MRLKFIHKCRRANVFSTFYIEANSRNNSHNLPDSIDPLGALVLSFDVEHPLNDGGQLEAADDECVGPRSVHRHDLAPGDSEVV